MGSGRRRRRPDPVTRAAWAEQRRNELPPGIPPDYFYDICTRIDLVGVWGCAGETHSLAATRSFIRDTDFDSREAEVLAWLESIGGCCDCSVQTKAHKRLLRLLRTWEEWDAQG